MVIYTMDPVQEMLDAVQKVLQPYIRPREEVAHIRRILTLHLSSGLKDGSPLTEPLSLTKSSETPSYPPEIRGPYRAYLEALSANIRARAEYQALAQKRSHPEVSILEKEETQPNYFLSHLASLKIQKKHEKLLVVEKNLDLWRQKPAASPDFLSHQRIFTDCRPLPEVSTEVVNSLALEQTSEDTTAFNSVQLKDLSDSLEHRTFQTNLSFKQEETLLENAKSLVSTVQPEDIGPEPKLQALNATRTELINWIETELGKASGDSERDGGRGGGGRGGGGRGGGGRGGRGGETAGQDDDHQGNNKRVRALAVKIELLNHQLASIKSKYAKYLAERKALLELVTTQLHSMPASSFKFPAITTSFPPSSASAAAASSPERPLTSTQQTATSATEERTPPIIDHLLTPTLTSLLALSHEHKGLIAHKAHITNLLTKQARENVQVLDHLAEESQLLPAHHHGHGHAMSTAAAAAEQSNDSGVVMLSNLVKPWVSAADSAKIATFEVVAEKIEEGQMALEGSIRLLEEVDRLMGRGPRRQEQEKSAEAAGGGEEEEEDDVGEESDIWLVEGQKSLEGGQMSNGSGLELGTRAHVEGGRKEERKARYRENGGGSIWDMLDVDVGLEKNG